MMKNLSLLLFFVLLLTMNATAQVELVNLSSTEENAKYVYRGATNLLFLNNADPYKTYDVKLNGETVMKVNWDQFMIKENLSQENKFDIYENDKLVKTDILVGKRIGDPEIRVGKLDSDKGTVESILESPMFTVVVFDNYKMDWFVSGFRMRILDAKGNLKMAFDPIKGGNFTPKQIEMISKLESGDQLEITDLVYTDATRVSRKKNQFFITIL